MKINDIKTEFRIIGTKQQLNKVNIKTLSVGESAVPSAAMARNLGVLFDDIVTTLVKLHYTISTTLEGLEITVETTLILAQSCCSY